MNKAINFMLFQTAWFAAVLGAAHGMPWLGVVAVPVGLAVHLRLVSDWRPELLLMLCAALIGFAFDTVLIAVGAFAPVPFVFPGPFSSLWMVMLWVNLAMTLHLSMSWLRGRYVLAAAFGALGGPLAYYGGAKLGAMIHLPDSEGYLAIGIAWAVAFPLLYGIDAAIRKTMSSPSRS